MYLTLRKLFKKIPAEPLSEEDEDIFGGRLLGGKPGAQ